MDVNEYLTDKIRQLTTIGGIGSGIIHIKIHYVTRGVTLNFHTPKIQLAHINTDDIDIIEYACIISQAGLVSKCEFLNIVLDYDNNSIYIDKENFHIMSIIEVEDETERTLDG